MGRLKIIWHVWRWDGTEFDLVWHDLTREEAEPLNAWRNARAEAQQDVTRYVIAKDGESPALP